MATNARASTANCTHSTSAGAGDAPKSYYEQQREMLMTEIAQSLEHVLQNVNRLNRSLEEVIQVGNEFAPVESLWSHFESVMGHKEEGEEGRKEGDTEAGGEETHVEEGDTEAEAGK